MHLEMRNAHAIWDTKPGEKRPLGRTTCRWEDNIKMYIRETGVGDVDWIHQMRIGAGGRLLWTQ
jgi:hypothetical protein